MLVAAGWIASALLLAAATPPPDSAATITARIEAQMKAFHGEIGLFAKDLDSGAMVSVNADERFPTASLIKVAVMAEVFHQIESGKLRRDTTVTLKESDKAGDETIPLNMLHPGVVLTIDDLLRFMIAYSDNTATNLLVGLVGTANVDALLDSYSLRRTRLYRPTFRDGHADVLPEEEKEYGLGSTTPHEIAKFLQLVAEGKMVNPDASDAMIALLATQQDRAMIPRSLPFATEKILVANKTGWDEEKNPDAKGFRGDVRNDAAYVKTPKMRYVIAICARRIEDKSSGVDNETLRLGAELSRMVYEVFVLSHAPKR